ncbi:hypothetical protein ACQCVK_17505 [Rossellomorea vietnamensis]|uniref:hypothetical protein n=1 Tax=Rossellomorea vietnamensis TaxID=218284 RepID=UPI003CF7DD8B
MEETLKEILGKLEKIDDRFEEQEKSINARFDEQDQKFNARLDQQDKKFGDRFDELEGKFNTRLDQQDEKFDARLDGLEGKVNTRLDQQDQKFDARLDELEGKVNTRLDQQDQKFSARLDKHDKAFARQENKSEAIYKRLSNLETGQDEIKEIAKRIETSQNEDVIALLRTFHTKIDSKTEVLNSRLFNAETDIQKLKK